MRSATLLVMVATSCSSAPPAEIAGEVAPPSPTHAAPPTVVPQTSLSADRSPVTASPPPAWTLTAADGSGLRLTTVDAKAVVEGPLAFTELHLRFFNPENRVREGTFAITLPQRAAVSRFALEENGTMVEAEVVAKQLARRAYDDMLHAQVDPAMLEKAPGNQFTARIFPIAPHAEKHLVISYSHELVGEGYRLALRGLPTIEHLSIRLHALRPDGSRSVETVQCDHWLPDSDFVGHVSSVAAVGAGGMVAGAFDVSAGATGVDQPTTLAIFVDTSGSRAAGFAGYVARVRELVTSLARTYDGLAIEVVAFDQEAKLMFSGPATAFGDGQVQALAARGAGGASDIGRALSVEVAARRALVIGDGVVTAGIENAALTAAATKRSFERVDVALVGGIRERVVADQLARTGKRPGDVFDLDREVATIARGIGESVVVDVPIAVAGAEWFYPKAIGSLRPSTRVMVVAKFAVDAAPHQFAVTFGAVTKSWPIFAAPPGLVERAVARAEIEELENGLATANPQRAAELRRRVARRSISARVMSSETTLLILDTAQDYARYGIDRRSLTDILTIGPDGLQQSHRQFAANPHHPPRRALEPLAGPADSAEPAASDDSESSRLAGAMISEGAAGGRAERSAAVSMPMIAMPTLAASGSLDSSLIRREIRRYIPKVTYCYERELLSKPHLHGVVTTQFTITGSGKVEGATARGVDDKVAACVAEVMSLIEFPAMPGGSSARVNYPFVFRPAGIDADLPPSEPTTTPKLEPDDSMSEFGPPIDALDGKLKDITRAIAHRKPADALAIARGWQAAEPTNLLAWVGLGQAWEASGDRAAAARAYGSIIDLFGSRAEMRRFAGERLERTGAIELAIDSYRRAVIDRPDQVTGHRLLAYALVRNRDYGGAWDAIVAGARQQLRDGSYAGAERLLATDLTVIGAVYRAHGGPRARIDAELAARGLAVSTMPATRFILYWETDANDVDLHIADATGEHAYYRHITLASGGELYADVTTGFGPECFEIEGDLPAPPYRLGVHYYAQGAMGYGMGLLRIERFDGKSITFDDRPFLIMHDQAYVSLGRLLR